MEFLSTENLLGIIALLMSTMNFQQSKIRGLLGELKNYFKEDTEIREKLLKKANKIFDRDLKED
jgi:hypothetical protein